MVDIYRSLLISFEGSSYSLAFMKTVQRSNMTLVVWSSYCLVHAATCCAHPLTAAFGVSLDYQGLKHLVLTSRTAVDAAISVSTYLHARARAGRELFSLHSPSAIFDFGRQFADESATLQTTWADQLAGG